MDLTKFSFPVPTPADMAFPTYDTIPELLAEAKERGFLYGNKPANELFSKLFFEGGSVNFRQDIDEEYRKRVWYYLRSLMGSFAPKHQHKEAICAMLLDEILVIPGKQ